MFGRMLAAALIGLGVSASAAQAQVVTSTSNAGPGTLRSAINQANANANLSVIQFNLPASAGSTIMPAFNLPAITAPVEIQGGGVLIDAVNTAQALALNTNDSVVRDLTIHDSSGAAAAVGIQVNGSRNQLEGNQIGTDASGLTLDMWNLTTGVAITGNENVVGGGVIAESSGDGLAVSGDRNVVAGVRLGLPYKGGLGNSGNGLTVTGDENQIGGMNAPDRNVVSENNGHGAEINGNHNRVEGNQVGSEGLANDDGVLVESSFNVVQDNDVSSNRDAGVKVDGDAAGPPPLGNLVDGNAITGNEKGVVVEDSHRNAITDNVIKSHEDEGVLIEAFDLPNANGNWLTGNTIAGNGLSGVRIEDADENLVGRPDHEVNTISGNGGDGVTVTTGQRNAIVNNSIYDNGDLGIDLAGDGPTGNDGLGDPDGGPNLLQNHPIITSHVPVFVGTFPDLVLKSRISWTLRSTAAADYRLEFYVNDTCNGRGEAKELLEAQQVATDATGLAQGSITVDPVDEKVTVTATETDPNGVVLDATSELSPCG